MRITEIVVDRNLLEMLGIMLEALLLGKIESDFEVFVRFVDKPHLVEHDGEFITYEADFMALVAPDKLEFTDSLINSTGSPGNIAILKKKSRLYEIKERLVLGSDVLWVLEDPGVVYSGMNIIVLVEFNN